MAGDEQITAEERPAVEAALGAWSLAGPDTVCTAITAGHINRTFLVETGGARLVLQRLSPIFGPELDQDIDALTRQLEAAGQTTPRLVPTTEGALHHHPDGDGPVWRLLTHVAGETIERVDSAARCREAGALLGRFHRALWDFDHVFRHRRLGVHDTAAHLRRLGLALERHAGAHRAYPQIEPVGLTILELAAKLRLPESLPERVVHGDPKISNVIFAADGRARCLVDLDTIGRMPLAVELGDALRSWCSPLGEEQQGPFEVDFYRATLTGWTEAIGALPTAAERAAIPPAVEVIALELAARFCTDALEERYFGWDRQRFASATDHNLARARSQLHLAQQVHQRMPELTAL